MEKLLRERLSKAFDECVEDEIKQNLEMIESNSMVGGLLVEAAVGNLYQSLKNCIELKSLCNTKELDYESILEDECKKALKRYLDI